MEVASIADAKQVLADARAHGFVRTQVDDLEKRLKMIDTLPEYASGRDKYIKETIELAQAIVDMQDAEVHQQQLTDEYNRKKAEEYRIKEAEQKHKVELETAKQKYRNILTAVYDMDTKRTKPTTEELQEAIKVLPMKEVLEIIQKRNKNIDDKSAYYPNKSQFKITEHDLQLAGIHGLGINLHSPLLKKMAVVVFILIIIVLALLSTEAMWIRYVGLGIAIVLSIYTGLEMYNEYIK